MTSADRGAWRDAYDERELEREWPALQAALARAARTWGRMVEPIQPEPRLVLPVAAPTLTVTMPAKKYPRWRASSSGH